MIGLDNLNDYYEVALKEDRLALLQKYDKFTFVKGDLADKETVFQIFREYKPQIVVNLAAQAGVRYSIDNPDAYKAEYYKYMLNGLMTQLMRIEPGKDVEEAHMRNRKLIAEWALEHGRDNNVVELVKIDGKTYVKINDYKALRNLFGQLLAEIQRIKSEGDYAAGAALVEKYAVKVDPALHREVLDRYAKLSIAPYRGFVNPVYTPVTDADGEITDIQVTYTEDYLPQMFRYSRDYSPLTH